MNSGVFGHVCFDDHFVLTAALGFLTITGHLQSEATGPLLLCLLLTIYQHACLRNAHVNAHVMKTSVSCCMSYLH